VVKKFLLRKKRRRQVYHEGTKGTKGVWFLLRALRVFVVKKNFCVAKTNKAVNHEGTKSTKGFHK